MRIVAVSGYRKYKNWKLVFDTLSDAVPVVNLDYGDFELKIGDCNIEEGPGADFFARQWFFARFGYNPQIFKADWNKFGNRAGPLRNQKMIDSGIDILYAFPSDASVGTKGCAEYAHSKGVKVIFPEMVLWHPGPRGKEKMMPEWFEWARKLK